MGASAWNNVQVWIPWDQIEELARWEKVRLIREPIRPQPQWVQTEALDSLFARPMQQLGMTGRWIRIGVIDVGFKGYQSLIGKELPASTVVKVFGDPWIVESNPHGTACAEIVHDVAPEAQLYLAAIGDMDVDFHRAVDWLRSQGVHVISSSIVMNLKLYCALIYYALYADVQTIWIINYLAELEKQWKQTVTSVVQSGVVWCQGAGNDAQKKWEGVFHDPDGDRRHNFSNHENYNEILIGQYVPNVPVFLVLAWDSEQGTTKNDYDLYIIDQYGQLVTGSVIDQNKLTIGIESCAFYPQPGRRYFVQIKNYNAQPTRLGLLLGYESFPFFKYYDASKTVLLNPPADHPLAITVGAVPFNAAHVIEPFSNQGPLPDGTIKPDVVGPDWVSTAAYGPRSFPGTSAAAPHVAGVAALIKQAHPDWGPESIKRFLQSRAIDLGPPGPDNAFGAGLVQALMLEAVTVPLVGDWDGDKTEELGWFKNQTFHFDVNADGWWEWTVPMGGPFDWPVVGDWDGSGRDKVGVYRLYENLFLLDTDGNGTVDRRIYLGALGDRPVVGDWDGDGIDDVGIYRPYESRFYLDFNEDGYADRLVKLGEPGDVPLSGDWDGDGLVDFGIYRPTVQAFYLDTDENGTADRRIRFGVMPWVSAFVGDWDGDQLTEIGIFDPFTETFFLDLQCDSVPDRFATIQ